MLDVLPLPTIRETNNHSFFWTQHDTLLIYLTILQIISRIKSGAKFEKVEHEMVGLCDAILGTFFLVERPRSLCGHPMGPIPLNHFVVVFSGEKPNCS
jgi:hypothetical protein